MNSELLLTVESSFVLTGLGVLVRGAAPALQHVALHTALPVALVFADGSRLSAIGTVEEITQPTDDAALRPEPALLLQLSGPEAVPPGTQVWRTEPATDPLFGGLL